jgi:hypothetical protein
MKQLKLLGILAVLALIVMAALPAGADTGKPSVAVGDVKVTPAALMPGDTGTITVTVTNPAKSLAGDSTQVSDTYNYGTGSTTGPGGQMSVQHSTTTSTSSSNAPDGAVMLKEVSLNTDAPVHVISKQFADVGRLGMGDTAKFTFTIKVDENAANTIYPITLRIRTDDDSVYLNYPISIVVDSSPLKVVLNDAPKAFSTTKKSVILDIVNLRPNGVEGVSVVPAGDEFIFKPMQEYVVGNIGTGEMYTVQFDVTSKNASYSGNPSFKVVYKNGDNWHEAGPLTVASDHSAITAAPASADNSSLLYLLGIIVLAAIVLGGIFLYMRGKRAKR